MNWVFRAWKKDTGNLRIMPNWLIKTFTRNCDLTDSRENSEQLYWPTDTSPVEISLSPQNCALTLNLNLPFAIPIHLLTLQVHLLPVKIPKESFWLRLSTCSHSVTSLWGRKDFCFVRKSASLAALTINFGAFLSRASNLLPTHNAWGKTLSRR